MRNPERMPMPEEEQESAFSSEEKLEKATAAEGEEVIELKEGDLEKVTDEEVRTEALKRLKEQGKVERTADEITESVEAQIKGSSEDTAEEMEEVFKMQKDREDAEKKEEGR